MIRFWDRVIIAVTWCSRYPCWSNRRIWIWVNYERKFFFRCRQEKYGLGIGYYFYLNSSYNAILFRYYSSVGKYKFILPITYDIETADSINPNILFSFVSLPIIGASFYRYYKGKDFHFWNLRRYYKGKDFHKILKSAWKNGKMTEMKPKNQ